MHYECTGGNANPADRGKVFAWIIAGVGIEARCNRKVSGKPQHHSISVRRTTGDFPSADSTSRSNALVDDKLLPGGFGELVGQETSNDSCGTAWSRSIDNGDRPRRVGLRIRNARHGRQRRSARCKMQKSTTLKFSLSPPEIVQVGWMLFDM